MKENNKAELLSNFDYFDSDVIIIADFGIKTKANVPITHIARNENNEISFWCGNPEIDVHASEIVVTEEERNELYEEILNNI